MSLIIGLTGGIGMGKSTISHMFEDAGIPVIDTESITHNLYKRGTKSYIQIVKHFGREILNPDRTINRGKLGAIVFKDKIERAFLNKILHPKIKQLAVEQILDLDSSIIVMDVPLLFEANFEDVVDKILVVYTTPEVQIERICKRNPKFTPEMAKLRVDAQMHIDKKKTKADYLIDNSGSLEKLEEQFETLLELLDKEVDDNESLY